MWLGVEYPNALRYVYKLREEGKIGISDIYPIARFPASVEVWLLVNCPYQWARDCITDAYLKKRLLKQRKGVTL
jgi:hypothetical protein